MPRQSKPFRNNATPHMHLTVPDLSTRASSFNLPHQMIPISPLGSAAHFARHGLPVLLPPAQLGLLLFRILVDAAAPNTHPCWTSASPQPSSFPLAVPPRILHCPLRNSCHVLQASHTVPAASPPRANISPRELTPPQSNYPTPLTNDPTPSSRRPTLPTCTQATGTATHTPVHLELPHVRRPLPTLDRAPTCSSPNPPLNEPCTAPTPRVARQLGAPATPTFGRWLCPLFR